MTRGVEQFLKSKALLLVDASGKAVQRDLQVSTAVLLMQMANIEGSFDFGDVTTLVGSLCSQFGLTEVEAGEVMEVADFLRREKGTVDDFVKLINERFERTQKITILGMLWKLMLADGLVTKLEAAFAVEVCQKLELGAEDVQQAKDLVERGEI
jgi:uncharacterized tellurite resistance protein B-like protein